MSSPSLFRAVIDYRCEPPASAGLFSLNNNFTLEKEGSYPGPQLGSVRMAGETPYLLCERPIWHAFWLPERLPRSLNLSLSRL